MVINNKDNGREIYLKVNEILELHLSENASTGFKWMQIITGNQILTLEKEEYAHSEFSYGGGTIHKWIFKANSPGDQKLKFIYQQPWIKDENNCEEFEVFLKV